VTTRKPPEDALISAAIRALRAGDRTTDRGPIVRGPAATSAPPSLSKNAIVSTLRTALLDRAPVWIGYADTDGTVTEQIVDPIRLGGGVLTAFDHRNELVRSFTVSRVTGVAELSSDDAGAS
jgi:predicted DNA-binding transcriptional regulator YafY